MFRLRLLINCVRVTVRVRVRVRVSIIATKTSHALLFPETPFAPSVPREFGA